MRVIQVDLCSVCFFGARVSRRQLERMNEVDRKRIDDVDGGVEWLKT